MTRKWIELAGIRKSFGGKDVLKGIDLTAESGDILSIAGPNGSGKTTTIRILLGTLKPDSGCVRLCGYDVSNSREQAVSQVGFVLEQPCLHTELTLDENLRIYSSAYKVDNPERRISDIIDLVDLSDVRFSPLLTYSKGMKQKAALARALLHDPDVLLFDEPTSGMDPLLQEEFRSLLQNLRESGKAILICSHNLLEIERIASHVAILDKGQILQYGKTKEVLSQHGYKKIAVRLRTPDQVRLAKGIAKDNWLTLPSPDPLSLFILLPKEESQTHVQQFLAQNGLTQCELTAAEVSLVDVFRDCLRDCPSHPEGGK